MLYCQPIENLNEIPPFAGDPQSVCRALLYHGTRKASVTANAEKRKHLADACERFLPFAQRFAKDPFNQTKIDAYRRETHDRYDLFCKSTLRLYRTAKNFEYGAFYLTNNAERAIRYAQNAGGELCELAYQNAMPLLDMGIPLPSEIKEAIAVIKAEHYLYAASEPLLLVVANCAFCDLRTETNAPVEKESADRLSEMGIPQSFRLSSPENYPLYVVRAPLFEECKKLRR